MIEDAKDNGEIKVLAISNTITFLRFGFLIAIRFSAQKGSDRAGQSYLTTEFGPGSQKVREMQSKPNRC